MAARLAIRRATLQDYQGVMNIGKIYQGRDYLPALYDKYLKRFNCYVGEIDGEIVTFHSDRLVDAGATIAIASGRVKERYRGRGIFADVFRYTYNSYKDMTSVKYITMTTDNVNMKLAGDRIKRKFTQILERELLEMIGNVEDLKQNKFESDETNVQELTSRDLKKIFQSKIMCSKLFPGERILQSGSPFRLLAQNIPLMMDGVKFWGTKSSDQSTYKTLTVTDKYNLGTELMFRLCIYGNDAFDIRQHALKHVQNLNQLVRNGTCTSIIIHIRHPLDCSDTPFLSVFRDFGLKINNEYATNRIILFERKISYETSKRRARLSSGRLNNPLTVSIQGQSIEEFDPKPAVEHFMIAPSGRKQTKISASEYWYYRQDPTNLTVVASSPNADVLFLNDTSEDE